MDMYTVAREATNRLGYSHVACPIEGTVRITWTCPRRAATFHIELAATGTGVLIRSPHLPAGGAAAGGFDQRLAAFVATLAFDLDLHLGVDAQTGAIEARQLVELNGLDPSLRRTALQHALHRFLGLVELALDRLALALKESSGEPAIGAGDDTRRAS